MIHFDTACILKCSVKKKRNPTASAPRNAHPHSSVDPNYPQAGVREALGDNPAGLFRDRRQM